MFYLYILCRIFGKCCETIMGGKKRVKMCCY